MVGCASPRSWGSSHDPPRLGQAEGTLFPSDRESAAATPAEEHFRFPKERRGGALSEIIKGQGPAISPKL
eukprot:5650199-Heterocapsa_arctica.AAC.1